MSLNAGVILEIKVTGAKGGAKAFQEFSDRVFNEIIPRNFRFHAEQATTHMTNEAPMRTGFLRSTIGYEITSGLTLSIFAWARYAGFVEFGTFRMPPRPFFFPNLNLWIRDRMPDAIRKDMEVLWRQMVSSNKGI